MVAGRRLLSLLVGERVLTDQLESRIKGRLFTTAGREPDKDKYCGSSVFYDAASGYIHVEHQVTFGSTDSINAKENFERLAHDHGHQIYNYHSDNDIYTSKAYIKHLVDRKQRIRYSGVGAKWQNGASENAIRIVVCFSCPHYDVTCCSTLA